MPDDRRVVVAPGILSMGQSLAAGTVNVFQKIFFRRLSRLNDSTDTVFFSETTSPPGGHAQGSTNQRRSLVQQAINELVAARNAVATETP